MTSTLTNVEKFHFHLLSPTSSTDSTVIERAQQLSSIHEQLKSSTQVKGNEDRFVFQSILLAKTRRVQSNRTILEWDPRLSTDAAHAARCVFSALADLPEWNIEEWNLHQTINDGIRSAFFFFSDLVTVLRLRIIAIVWMIWSRSAKNWRRNSTKNVSRKISWRSSWRNSIRSS